MREISINSFCSLSLTTVLAGGLHENEVKMKTELEENRESLEKEKVEMDQDVKKERKQDKADDKMCRDLENCVANTEQQLQEMVSTAFYFAFSYTQFNE